MQYYCYAFEKVLPCFCVKQHSVNCIPAALYLVTQNFPEWITLADARIFISNLFVKPEGFSEEEAYQVREHIRVTFEQYLVESKTSANWYEPIWKFLLSYGK